MIDALMSAVGLLLVALGLGWMIWRVGRR